MYWLGCICFLKFFFFFLFLCVCVWGGGGGRGREYKQHQRPVAAWCSCVVVLQDLQDAAHKRVQTGVYVNLTDSLPQRGRAPHVMT